MKLKTYLGKKVDGAYEKYLEASKDKRNPPEQKISENLTAQDKGNYIYLPNRKLYVAKERTHFNKNWYQALESLHNENARMLTLAEFVDFLNILRNGNDEFKRIYNEITEVKDPLRTEWIDADFKVINNILHINYNHRTVNGRLTPQTSERLEACLMEDCKVDLNSFNRQGLPTRKGNDLYYYFPRSDNNSVARFCAGSGGASLDCYGYPGGSDSSLGVFSCAEAVQKN